MDPLWYQCIKKSPRTAEKKHSSATSNENRKSQANHDMHLCCIPLTASICYLLSVLLLTALKLKRTLNWMLQSCQKTDFLLFVKMNMCRKKFFCQINWILNGKNKCINDAGASFLHLFSLFIYLFILIFVNGVWFTAKPDIQMYSVFWPGWQTFFFFFFFKSFKQIVNFEQQNTSGLLFFFLFF